MRRQILNKHVIITSIFFIIIVAHLKSCYGPPVSHGPPVEKPRFNITDIKVFQQLYLSNTINQIALKLCHLVTERMERVIVFEVIAYLIASPGLS